VSFFDGCCNGGALREFFDFRRGKGLKNLRERAGKCKVISRYKKTALERRLFCADKKPEIFRCKPEMAGYLTLLV